MPILALWWAQVRARCLGPNRPLKLYPVLPPGNGPPWELQFAAEAYNTFILPTMTFVAQLERPPPEALQAEDKALFKAAKGPGQWAKKQDLFLLQQSYGLPFRFRSLEHTALAAQVRVALWEDATSGGLHVRDRAKELRNWMIYRTNHLNRLNRWDDWYTNSGIFTLETTMNHFRRVGLSPTTILHNLSRGTPRPWPREVAQHARRATQRTAYQHLLQRLGGDALARTVHKIKRWNFTDPAVPLASRILDRMRFLQPLVPPRVQAAVFSTVWNRWTTARRFQTRGVPCLLGCDCRSSEDSIEHYLRCPLVLGAAAARLRLHLQPDTSFELLMLARQPPPGVFHRSWYLRCAVLVYAVYRVTNTARHRGQLTPSLTRDALKEGIYEAVRGHPGAMRCVDTVYMD